eukprot:g31647.t1
MADNAIEVLIEDKNNTPVKTMAPVFMSATVRYVKFRPTLDNLPFFLVWTKGKDFTRTRRLNILETENSRRKRLKCIAKPGIKKAPLSIKISYWGQLGRLEALQKMKRTIDQSRLAEKKQRTTQGGLEVRCLISSGDCGAIIGKGGATISRIREATGTSISILKEASRGAPERVVRVVGEIAGCTQAVEEIAGLICEQGAASTSGVCQFKLLIHGVGAGALIGKGGQTIKAMQESSQARIQLSNEPLEGSTDKSVTISGAVEAIQAALKQVVPKLEGADPKPGTTVIPYVPGKAAAEAQMQGGGAPGGYGLPYGADYGYGGYGVPYGGSAPPAPPYSAGPPAYSGNVDRRPRNRTPAGAGASSPHAGGVESFYMIPTSGAGALIGKGGSIINNIKAQSGTQIIISDPEPSNPAERKVKITGPAQGVEIALQRIKQLFSTTEDSGAPKETAFYMIPTASAGSLIGKGGSIIGHIKAQSGTQITISEPDPSNPKEREVKITGSRHGVQVAVYNIKQRMEQTAPATSGRPSADVHPLLRGRSIIGKAGSVVKEINAMSGCQIRLSEADRENPSAERVVTITGLAQNIPTAVNMIRQRLDSIEGAPARGLPPPPFPNNPPPPQSAYAASGGSYPSNGQYAAGPGASYEHWQSA